MVLCARPGIGAVTLALLFGLFNLIAGTWMLVHGIELHRTGKTLRSVRDFARKEWPLRGSRADVSGSGALRSAGG